MKKYRNDVILIAALLLVAFLGAAYMFSTRETGAYAVVSLDGEDIYRLPLSEDITVDVGKDGAFNTIVIKDGSVCVSDASCPDHVCINQGGKMYDGETIVCLPNRLVITVTGGDTPEIDATVR